MDKQIGKIVRRLKLQYGLFIGIAVLLCIAYETGLLPEGICVGDVRMEYIMETIGILLAVIAIPLSLKLFSFVLKKRIVEKSVFDAFGRYCFWSGVRLFILLVPVLFNLVVYYSTLSNVGILCALMTIVASFFCIPGEKRLREELYLDKSENELIDETK